MSQNVTITYFGMHGAGRNVTEARKDAGRKIEAALTGTYAPHIVSWRGWAILVYRDAMCGWCTAIVVAGEGMGPCAGDVHGTTGHADRQAAILAAQRHIADLGWKEEDGETPPRFLTDRDAISEYQRKVRFWLRCLKARRAGLTDADEVRAYGCETFCPPEILARVDGPSPAVA